MKNNRNPDFARSAVALFTKRYLIKISQRAEADTNNGKI